MKILALSFNSTVDLNDEVINCMLDFNGECPSNTCDCDYNCFSDDDCTQDTDF